MSYDKARRSSSVHLHDFIDTYVADLENAVDLDLIKSAGVKIGIDPLGGAAVHFWQPIVDQIAAVFA
jgi:phosphoglucomutase